MCLLIFDWTWIKYTKINDFYIIIMVCNYEPICGYVQIIFSQLCFSMTSVWSCLQSTLTESSHMTGKCANYLDQGICNGRWLRCDSIRFQTSSTSLQVLFHRTILIVSTAAGKSIHYFAFLLFPWPHWINTKGNVNTAHVTTTFSVNEWKYISP